jgi:hypothetical protein
MPGTSGGTRPRRPWQRTLTLLLSLVGLPALATAQPTAPGDRVTVQYGDEPGWDFGILDKRLLDKTAE